jgi:diguanylate cyclase (GGDEF)-like protein
MLKYLNVRIYCEGVFVAACVVVAGAAGSMDFSYLGQSPLTFAALFAGVMLGELMPLKIPRRGNDEEITLSTSFAMALMLAGGLAPALIAQCTASVVQDRMSGKPWWRVRFNVGQYALAMAGAWGAMRVLAAAPQVGSAHPFSSADLPGMMVAAAVFFFVNTTVVGTAVSLYQGIPVGRYLRNDPLFVLVTGVVMLMLAPIVFAAAAFSVVLVPLCLAPVVAIYNTMTQGARNEYAARHDSLTGLPNRTAFADELTDVLEKQAEACVLLLDLDRFKDVNDTLGHRYGDLLLEQVAARFRDGVGGEAEIARLGGDEFAVVSALGKPEDAFRLARQLASSLRAPFQIEQMVVDVQASVGIALFPDHGSAVETLLQKADVAMYRAKETRAGVALYDERYDHHSPAKLALTAELRTAIQDQGIVVWYQPELDLETGRVLALEALVRWEHPNLGLLRPKSFVNVAERTNLIKPLTDKVIELALHQVSIWAELGLDVTVAVNISAQVLVDHEFTHRVMTALAKAAVAPQALKLEVTESGLMADPVTAREVLQDLDRLGVAISIDDFGTGYSSLAYLADLPVSEVKIDQSFVSRMADGSSETIIVNSTIDLAHHLDLRAVAEGVEDASMLAELEALGCDAAQGYAISQPMTAADATNWLATELLLQRDDRAERQVA